MPYHLQMVFLMNFVQVYTQTCYEKCLQEAYTGITNVTIMVADASVRSSYFYTTRQWLDRKTIEFNGLYPAISVELLDVNYTRELLEDTESGRNTYHAYILPFMSAFGVTTSVADQLLDLSTLTVANVNHVAWHTIGRFYRAHSSLFDGKVVSLPLSGDFLSLFYRTDVFEAYGMRVPRTLKEYVFASQAPNGTDLNGDGEEDYGSCMSHAGSVGGFSDEVFYAWIAQVLQYRGTSQGAMLDTDTLNPLLENPAVHEALKLWKQVAGLPELTGTLRYPEILHNFW